MVGDEVYFNCSWNVKCTLISVNCSLKKLMIESNSSDYILFGEFMNKTGRPMLYSCSWPVYQEYNGIMVGVQHDSTTYKRI